MPDLTTTAVGTWSGGRFMHFGEPLDDERLAALVRPGGGHRHCASPPTRTARARPTRCSAARSPACRASRTALVGAIGHDFYEGEREGAKGFPRFTDPRLRGPDAYGDYVRMATERSLERCGVDAFDLLLLHNPDRMGYTSERGVGRARGGARRGADARASASPPGRPTASRST